MNTLTVAMACYRSFESAYFTLMALRTYHGYQFDILVVDNAPESCIKTAATTRSARGQYVHRPDLNGTTRPRNACFQYAKTPWVMVIDDHVLLDPGAVAAAIEYANRNPESRDIISGPLMGDDGRWTGTHWESTEAYGLWGTWACDPKYQARWGQQNQPDWNPTAARTAVDRMEPFEIPAMGLGLWMMRKAAWPELNPHFRGFGGEEGYIHEKVRRLGGKAICHPRLRWFHQFRDVAGKINATPYPLTLGDQIRNMYLGSLELGVDISEPLWERYAKPIGRDAYEDVKRKAEALQPYNTLYRRRKVRVLGVWYTNNAAPEPLLQKSLQTIHAAKSESFHDVRVTTSVWNPIAGNPFPTAVAGPDIREKQGHGAIVRQIADAIRLADTNDWEPEIICHLEHDVLYPPGYFDRMADAYIQNDSPPVILNQDYIGLNSSGWLKTIEHQEPLHQMAIRKDVELENLERALKECNKQGWSYLEPDYGTNLSKRVRLPVDGFTPAVHVGHQNRLTNHHETTYEKLSSMGPNGQPLSVHSFWGDHRKWWPYTVEEKKDMACGGCQAAQKAAQDLKTLQEKIGQNPTVSLTDWFEAEKKVPPDFHAHMEPLRDLCANVKHATEMSAWPKQAYLAIAAGMPKDGVLVSCASGQKHWWARMVMAKGVHFKMITNDSLTAEIEPTELLFLDSSHTAQRTFDELNRHAAKVSKYIVIHTVATDTFGEHGDDGGPGVMYGVRQWLRSGASAEWVVKSFTDVNHGLIVLSRDPADRPKVSFGARSVLRYLGAKMRHKLNGGTYLPLPMAQERLDICLTCEHRGGEHGNNCKICKCFLAVLPDNAPTNAGGPGKTFHPTEACPIERWSVRPNDGVAMTEDEVHAMLKQLTASEETSS